MLLDMAFSNGGEGMRLDDVLADDNWAQLAQATGMVHSRFACGIDEAERLLRETARQARMHPVTLAERLLDLATREAALAAVALVHCDRKPGG